ncbi:hypothetical protein L313_1325 [Acinetobacter haemolyticus CIP 64.3 = MTCC 9819]|nr:hypothetical protein L313_1325 [Acinetobacter haemolyticus CIP 64.3 = MTCC 9819]
MQVFFALIFLSTLTTLLFTSTVLAKFNKFQKRTYKAK